MDTLRLVFAVLLIVYSLVWFAAYRCIKRERAVSMRRHSTPIENTRAEERARSESSFEIARGRQFGITRAGFFSLIMFGYVALVVAFAIASIILRSPTT